MSYKRQLSKPLQEFVWDINRVAGDVDKLKRDLVALQKTADEIVNKYMNSGRKTDVQGIAPRPGQSPIRPPADNNRA